LAVTTDTLLGVAIPVIVAGAEDPLLPLPTAEAPPEFVPATPELPHPTNKAATTLAPAIPVSLRRILLNLIAQPSIYQSNQ
jgi:hypothetical protein